METMESRSVDLTGLDQSDEVMPKVIYNFHYFVLVTRLNFFSAFISQPPESASSFMNLLSLGQDDKPTKKKTKQMK